MKSPWMRSLAVPLMLACAGGQAAAGSALLASALTLGLDGTHRHAHSVTLVADAGHLDLVLSHDRQAADPHGAAPRHGDPPASFSTSDHIFHITGDDAANASARRVDRNSAPVVAVAFRAPSAPVLARILQASPEPRGLGSEHLKTTVLRL